MTQRTRNELKDLFKTGAKPSGDDFKAFIDSTLNVSDDGIAKAAGADTPLKINAQGTDEKLLDFYTGETKTWSINQKPADDKSGLNIANTGGTKLFIDSSTGNVGIGTIDPTAKLEVSGNLQTNVARIDNRHGDDLVVFSHKDCTAGTSYALAQNDDGETFLNAPADKSINFTNNGNSIKMVIDNSTGNVGIGTIDPTAKLEVSGDLKLQSGVAVNEFSTDGTLAGNSDLAIPTEKAVKTYADTKALLAGSSSQNFSTKDLTANGNLQTNVARIDNRHTNAAAFSHKDCTTTTNYALAQDNDGATFLNAAAAQEINFAINDSYKMTLDSSGNLGIGTIDPTAKLEVSGDLKLQSGVAVNEFSTDGTLAGNSDLAIPTEKAVKTYANTKALLAGSSSQNFSTKDLTANGNLQTNVARIDNRDTGWAMFSHKDCTTTENYALAHNENGTIALNASNGQKIFFAIQASNKMTLDSSGNLGIGTISPSKGKLQVEGSKSYTDIGGYYYIRKDGTHSPTDDYNAPYSIYASSFIGATQFNAFSDLRIKEVKGVSDSKSDLNVLRQINITDYTYKDKIANDDKPRKKVIGQQVAEVFPQAVKTHTDVVPDIFKSASITNGWVNLCDHGLQVGERIKLVLESSDSKICTIEAVTPEGFQVSLDHEGEVFVYGREVDDFHVVDYDALAMLNISATQELCKIIDALKIEVKQLKGSDHPMAAFTNS